MYKITFLPRQVSIDVDEGTTILHAACLLGLSLPASCGGKGLCGKCRVKIKSGDVTADVSHEHALSKAEIAAGWRLACLASINNDLVVEVEKTSNPGLVLTDFNGNSIKPDSYIKRLEVRMSAPVLEDQDSDLERLANGIGREISPLTSFSVIRKIPHILRQHNFQVAAVLADNALLDLLSLADKTPLLGLAIDLGTTTIAGVLLDLQSGENLAIASCTNPQAIHGDDVISRIEYGAQTEKNLEQLSTLAVESINKIIEQVMTSSAQNREHLYEVVIAGNTTMQHLLLGLTPKHIGITPFVAVQRQSCTLPAESLGIAIAPAGIVYTMPSISGYVGGDIVAGLLAHVSSEEQKNILFIDIGTNGEMAIITQKGIYACSTAAGPAFEGARIQCGMRAAAGAISGVNIGNDDILLHTVEGAEASGICGTGLLDAVAVLLTLGVLDETGRLLEPDELAPEISEKIKNRLQDTPEGKEFVLFEKGAESDVRISLTARDIRELQLAKGAIAAGSKALLKFANLEIKDLDNILLAGAFGNFLSPKSASRIGLLPSEIELEKVVFVGNASLAGSRIALLNQQERKRAVTLAAEVNYVELSGRADFQEIFMQEMLFPTPDLSR